MKREVEYTDRLVETLRDRVQAGWVLRTMTHNGERYVIVWEKNDIGWVVAVLCALVVSAMVIALGYATTHGVVR